VVQPGEAIGFDGQLPIRLTIGNAPATRLRFKGQPVELAASTRDNVARLELQ
jgi:cytoskeleton protein RodZ